MIFPETGTVLILGTPSLAWAIYCGLKTGEDMRRHQFWMAVFGLVCTLVATVFLLWTLGDLFSALTAKRVYISN